MLLLEGTVGSGIVKKEAGTEEGEDRETVEEEEETERLGIWVEVVATWEVEKYQNQRKLEEEEMKK